MKKILLLAAMAAAVFTAGSCQKEIAYLDGDTKVTFEVSTGDIATKAIADGTNISVLHWELYGADIRTAQAPYGEDTVVDTDGDKKFTVELTLVADQDYNIVFWAETEDGQAHYVTDDLRSVKIKDYTDETANDESRAAFFATYGFHTQNGQNLNETITLYRPFSQINLGATNYETSLNLVNGGKIIVESTEMTVSKIADSFNTLDGVGETSAAFDGTVTFAAAATPNGTADQTDKLLSVNGEPYYWVGMNYLIVEGNSDAVTVDVTLNTNMGVVSHSISNVPVKENYRTNILGDFLTTGAKFNIVVDERFQQPDEIVSIWNGSAIEEPAYDAATETYEIENAAELAWLAAEVNGGETFAGKTVKVVADIDLVNAAWQPIGYWETFEGTFDGGNHIIRNLNVTATEADCYLGLFGCTNNATIKNVHIHNATVKATVGDNSWAGGHLGALVGYPDGTTVIENITLTGDVFVEGPMDKKGAQRIGAVVGGFEAVALTMNNITVDASASSYVKGNLLVGGVVGGAICPVTMTDVTSNIDVYSQDGIVGGIFGYAPAKSVITNCTATGDVYRVAVASTATENQIKRIGGIAGTWESAHSSVVLENCAFEGTLYVAGAPYTDYVYGGLVGRGYTLTAAANGVIKINGLTYPNEGEATDAAGNYVVYTVEALQAIVDNAAAGTTNVIIAKDLAGDVTVAEKADAVIVIDGAGHKYDGTIKIHANSSRNTGAVELKNICFETSTKSEEFIQALDFGNAKRYSQNITVKDCSFVGVLGSEAEKTAVGIKVNATQNFNAINCTAANLHSFMQAQSCDQNVTIDGLTTENCKNGVSFGNTAYPTLKNATIVAAEYGIRADGDASRGNLVVENSTVTAKQPVIVRKVTTDGYAVALNAAVLNTSEAYHVVFTSGSDDAAYVAPVKAFSITGADGYSVFPL